MLVRGEGIEARILQMVGIDLGLQADSATLLAQVEQHAALGGEAVQGRVKLLATVTAQGPKHVTGEALGMDPHQRRIGWASAGRNHRDMVAVVAEVVEGDHAPRSGP